MQAIVRSLPAFAVEVSELPLGMMVRIKGYLGMCDQAELHGQLTAIALRRPRLVVLDLAQLEFVSSVAFCALIVFRQDIVRAGGSIRITAMQPLVEEAFTVLRLHSLFEVCETVEEAFAL
jgi:anti-anti-sigma factor